MRKVLIIFLFIVGAQASTVWEAGALNLKVPSNLDGNSLVFEFQHRFYGVLTEDPLENFFGLNLGANVNMGIRYAIIPRLEFNVSYTTFEKEYRVGASYAHALPQLHVKGQLDIQYFDFKRGQDRFGNLFYSIALQSEPIANTFIPAVNIGYDGYNEKFGLGFGLDAGFDWEFGPIQHVSLIGEYYPVLSSEEGITGPNNSFATGLRIDTYGHHFMLQISNGWAIGPRRLMLGALTNDLYLGLNIHRHLQF